MASSCETRKDLFRVTSLVMMFTGIPGHVFCVYNHMCSHGHCYHPPYPFWHLINDWVWMFMFLSSALIALWSNIYLRYWYCLSLLLLFIPRSGLGSAGPGPLLFDFRALTAGGIMICESPIWLFIILVAGASLLRNTYRVQPGCCKKCGYNLTGNVSGRCPECGAVIASETDTSDNDDTPQRHYGW